MGRARTQVRSESVNEHRTLSLKTQHTNARHYCPNNQPVYSQKPPPSSPKIGSSDSNQGGGFLGLRRLIGDLLVNPIPSSPPFGRIWPISPPSSESIWPVLRPLGQSDYSIKFQVVFLSKKIKQSILFLNLRLRYGS